MLRATQLRPSCDVSPFLHSRGAAAEFVSHEQRQGAVGSTSAPLSATEVLGALPAVVGDEPAPSPPAADEGAVFAAVGLAVVVDAVAVAPPQPAALAPVSAMANRRYRGKTPRADAGIPSCFRDVIPPSYGRNR